jgi:DNA-binding transcriptional ArsR family regulator
MRLAALDAETVSLSLRFVVAYQAGPKLEALGDRTRRAIFERLARGPLAVVDIARELPVSRPAVSQHLKVLKDVGLVSDRAEGTRRVYQVDPEGLAALRAYLDGIWSEALDAFAQLARASYAAGVPDAGRPAREERAGPAPTRRRTTAAPKPRQKKERSK